MNPTPSDCQKQIKEVTEHLRYVLDHKISAGEPESWEADICLATRSAYFDFYTWVVLNGMVDEPAERDLDELFRRSLALMEPGQFKDSVKNRYKEFKALCEHVRDGHVRDGAASASSI